MPTLHWVKHGRDWKLCFPSDTEGKTPAYYTMDLTARPGYVGPDEEYFGCVHAMSLLERCAAKSRDNLCDSMTEAIKVLRKMAQDDGYEVSPHPMDTVFLFVPYDPCGAHIVEHATEEAAVHWFRQHARAHSSARANLNTADGRCLASFSDGEFDDHRPKESVSANSPSCVVQITVTGPAYEDVISFLVEQVRGAGYSPNCKSAEEADGCVFRLSVTTRDSL